jgi:RimJ/RimL family protein N-acetyltransferase
VIHPPYVALERLATRHLPGVRALISDPVVVRFTRVPEPTPGDFARSWLDRYVRGERDGTCAGFAALGEAGRFLGLGLAPAIDHSTGDVELGYVVAWAARGRGVAGEILRQLTAWAFAEAGAQRIALIVDVENVASSHVAARAGYVREGVMRSIFVKPGVRRDAELWARLAADQGP